MIKLSNAYQKMESDWIKELTDLIENIYGKTYNIQQKGNHIYIGKGKKPYPKITLRLQVTKECNIAEKNGIIEKYTVQSLKNKGTD